MNIAEAREKIRTTQIVKRLQGHIDGDIEMVPSQVTAALGLLRKSIPDLAAVTHQGDADNPVKIEHAFRWLAQQEPSKS